MHDVAPGFLLPGERVNDFAGERLGDDPSGKVRVSGRLLMVVFRVEAEGSFWGVVF